VQTSGPPLQEAAPAALTFTREEPTTPRTHEAHGSGEHLSFSVSAARLSQARHVTFSSGAARSHFFVDLTPQEARAIAAELVAAADSTEPEQRT
jgi:hypothetical protein